MDIFTGNFQHEFENQPLRDPGKPARIPDFLIAGYYNPCAALIMTSATFSGWETIGR